MSGGWRRIRLVIKYLFAGAGTLGVAGQSLVASGQWTDPTPLERRSIIGASLAGAAVVLLRDGYADFFGRRRAELKYDISKVLIHSVMKVSRATGYDITDIGVSAFLTQWDWRHPRHQHLKRLGRERLGNNPQPSNIHWRKDVGVIGQVWATNHWKCVDTRELWESFQGCTEQRWNRAPKSVTMGLSFAQFQEIADKYGTILAVEMKDTQGHLIGVVAIDVQVSDRARMAKKDIRDIACDAANLIAKMLTGG